MAQSDRKAATPDKKLDTKEEKRPAAEKPKTLQSAAKVKAEIMAVLQQQLGNLKANGDTKHAYGNAYVNPIAFAARTMQFSAESKAFLQECKDSAKLVILEDHLKLLKAFYEERKKVNDLLGNLYKKLTFNEFILRLFHKRYKMAYLDGRCLVGRDEEWIRSSNNGASGLKFLDEIGTEKDVNGHYKEYLTLEETGISWLVLPQARSAVIGTGSRNKVWPVGEEFKNSLDCAVFNYPAFPEFRGGRTAHVDLYQLAQPIAEDDIAIEEYHQRERRNHFKQSPSLMAVLEKIYRNKFDEKINDDYIQVKMGHKYPVHYINHGDQKDDENSLMESLKKFGVVGSATPSPTLIRHGNKVSIYGQYYSVEEKKWKWKITRLKDTILPMLPEFQWNAPKYLSPKLLPSQFYADISDADNDFKNCAHVETRDFKEPNHYFNKKAYINRVKEGLKQLLISINAEMKAAGLGTTFQLKGLGLGAFGLENREYDIVLEQLFIQALHEILNEINLDYIKTINLINFPSSFNPKDKSVKEEFAPVKGIRVVRSTMDPTSKSNEALVGAIGGTVFCGDSASMVGNEGMRGIYRNSSDDPATLYALLDPYLFDPRTNPRLLTADCIHVVNEKGFIPLAVYNFSANFISALKELFVQVFMHRNKWNSETGQEVFASLALRAIDANGQASIIEELKQLNFDERTQFDIKTISEKIQREFKEIPGDAVEKQKEVLSFIQNSHAYLADAKKEADDKLKLAASAAAASTQGLHAAPKTTDKKSLLPHELAKKLLVDKSIAEDEKSVIGVFQYEGRKNKKQSIRIECADQKAVDRIIPLLKTTLGENVAVDKDEVFYRKGKLIPFLIQVWDPKIEMSLDEFNNRLKQLPSKKLAP